MRGIWISASGDDDEINKPLNVVTPIATPVGISFREEIERDKNDNLSFYNYNRNFLSLWGLVVICEYTSALVTGILLVVFIFRTGYWNGDGVTVQTWGPLAVWNSAYDPNNKTLPLESCDRGSCQQPVEFKFYGSAPFTVTALPRASVSVTTVVVLVQSLSFAAQLARGLYLWTPCYKRRRIVGPDWTRWLEYGITSPLMVVVVALSWLAAEQETLLLLVAAQLACVILGQIIEEKLHTILVQDKNPSWWQKWEVGEWHVASWLFHAAVWVTIIMRKTRLSDFISGCTKQVGECPASRSLELPVEADVILWGTFIAFSLFGINNIYAVVRVLGFANLYRNIYQDQRKKYVYNLWTANALRYSVLSLTAKLLLQVSFWFFAVTLQDNKGVDTRLTVQAT